MLLLVRNKSLSEMSFVELILYLKKLVKIWDLEVVYLPAGISKIEGEIDKTMNEIIERR